MPADLPPDPDALNLAAGHVAAVHVGDGRITTDVDLEVGDECDPLLDVATDVDVTDDALDGEVTSDLAGTVTRVDARTE